MFSFLNDKWGRLAWNWDSASEPGYYLGVTSGAFQRRTHLTETQLITGLRVWNFK